jgi:hypothetical protein
MRTQRQANDERLIVNHNHGLSHEQKNDVDQMPAVEVEEAELEAIAAALRVRSGLQAGLIPCL